MATKAQRSPGPDHPIGIIPNPNRVVVKIAGVAVADTIKDHLAFYADRVDA
jgi:uncharacterized protein (DUF427 family)